MKKLSKAEILANIHLEHKLLLETLNDLSQSQLIEPGVIATPAPGQSCKDILAHLTAWEHRMRNIIQAITANESIPSYPSTGKFNAQVFHENQALPLVEVQANFRRSYD